MADHHPGPWRWADAYGGEGGDALLRENDGNGAVLLEAACSTDDISPRVRVLIELAPNLERLWEIEWSGGDSECPACGAYRPASSQLPTGAHRRDCWLGKTIDALALHWFAGTGPLCGASMACRSTDTKPDVTCARCRARMGGGR